MQADCAERLAAQVVERLTAHSPQLTDVPSGSNVASTASNPQLAIKGCNQGTKGDADNARQQQQQRKAAAHALLRTSFANKVGSVALAKLAELAAVSANGGSTAHQSWHYRWNQASTMHIVQALAIWRLLMGVLGGRRRQV